jgi:hypothetical protein
VIGYAVGIAIVFFASGPFSINLLRADGVKKWQKLINWRE